MTFLTSGLSDIAWLDAILADIEDPVIGESIRNLVRNLEFLTSQLLDVIPVTYLTTDVVNDEAVANTIADVTDLGFTVLANETHWFRFHILYDADAKTTGSRWSINGPAAPTLLAYRSQYGLTTASIVANEGLSSYDLPAGASASSPATSGNVAIVEGVITTSQDGEVIARFASEVSAAAITAKAGSFVEHRRLK